MCTCDTCDKLSFSENYAKRPDNFTKMRTNSPEVDVLLRRHWYPQHFRLLFIHSSLDLCTQMCYIGTVYNLCETKIKEKKNRSATFLAVNVLQDPNLICNDDNRIPVSMHVRTFP